MELKKGQISIDLDWIGEGWSGDFDPEDPNDEKLLRFSVYHEDVEIYDASYCTRLPESISDELKMKALELLMNSIYWPVSNDQSIKRLCEDLSWIGPDWL